MFGGVRGEFTYLPTEIYKFEAVVSFFVLFNAEKYPKAPLKRWDGSIWS